MRFVSLLSLLVGCSALSPAGDERAPGSGDGRTTAPLGLLLSEIADHDSGVKLVELCNRSERSIDLQGVWLERYANGNLTSSRFDLPSVQLAPGQAFVVGQAGQDEDFLATFGRSPDATSITVSGNGDDVYQLAWDGGVVDRFGEIGVDGTGTPWDYTDTVAARDEAVGEGSETWDGASWSFGVEASPGQCGGPVVTTPPAEGTLLISEVMDDASDSALKYVEVCNLSGAPAVLDGLSLERFSNGNVDGSSVALQGTLLPGQGIVVVNPSGADAYSARYGRLPEVQSSVANGNGDDVYQLTRDGETVDAYGERGVDGSGTAWDYADSNVTRRGTSASALFDPSDWSVVPEGAGTPGICPAAAIDPADCGPDADGDGFQLCQDCDDTDPSVHPGAFEACDGIDNDCDGLEPDDEDTDGDGVLECAACDDAGLWAGSVGLSGSALRGFVEDATDGQWCGWNTSRRELFGNIFADNGVVTGIYTGTTATAVYDTTAGPLDTEHAWPQSQGAGGGLARCDLHHLYPAASTANTARGNLPFGEVQAIDDVFGDSAVGWDTSGERVFEPPAEVKGDLARSLLYMELAHGLVWPLPGYRDRMVRWASEDPPDAAEREKTHRIDDVQGRVNPLVVCPSFSDRL